MGSAALPMIVGSRPTSSCLGRSLLTDGESEVRECPWARRSDVITKSPEMIATHLHSATRKNNGDKGCADCPGESDHTTGGERYRPWDADVIELFRRRNWDTR